MRRNLRLLGFAIVVTTILLLISDLLKHSVGADDVQFKSKPSPAGFSHDLTGTGKITTAFAGRVTIIAEESKVDDGGGSTFAPRYRVEGDDPTPSAGGMTLSTSVIVSSENASDASKGFRVDAPECWLPIDKKSSTLRFDFNELWQLTKPIFSINDFGKGGTLTIKSTLAQLDPQTNLVVTEGFFTLDVGDLHLEGESLTLNPETSSIEFTPYHGALRWSIRNADGQVITGDSDGPGSFVALENGDYLLTINSKTSVRTQFPKGASIVGDIETPLLKLRLAPSDSGNWRPRIATLAQPTLWHGETLQLRGADSTISWLGNGTLNDFIINGPINVVPNNGAFIKTSASKYAQLFANENVVHLAGDVTIHRVDGSVKGNLAVLGNNTLAMQGAVSVIGDRGTATADKFSTDADNNWQLDGSAYVNPADDQIGWLSADHLSFSADGVINGAGNFLAELEISGRPAKLACDKFVSIPGMRYKANRVMRDNSASGNVIVESSDGVVFGDLLDQLDDQRYLIRANDGNTAYGTIRAEQQEVSFRANSILYSKEQVVFSESPLVKVPVGELGLAKKSVTLVANKIVLNLGQQLWTATKDVLLSGAIVGNCQYLSFSSNKVVLRGGSAKDNSLCGASTTFADHSRIDLEGDLIEYVVGRSLIVNDNVYVKRVSETTDWLRCEQLNATNEGGHASGDVEALFAQSSMTCRSVDWTRDDGGENLVLSGNPRLDHPQATVDGHRIELSPKQSTITAHGDAQNPATIKRVSGQSASGSWIKYNYDTQSLNAQRATFEDKP